LTDICKLIGDITGIYIEGTKAGIKAVTEILVIGTTGSYTGAISISRSRSI
jgi:hypothetical protein